MGFDYAPKIAALLANADDESLSDAARESYRAKAAELMIRYRIAEEQALATDVAASAPISHRITLCTYGNPMLATYASVFSRIAHHAEVRYMTDYDNGNLVATVVGYEGDVRYAELLWTSALLVFATRIDPRWDDTLTEAENIFRLRNAGIERRVIADRAWGNGVVPAARSKVQRIYLRECQRRGEPVRAAGLGHNTATYREAYARSFRDGLSRRLWMAADAADTATGGVVLHGRTERVNEAFYALFPFARPSTDPAPERTPCPRCAKAKSGACRDHTVRWTKADEARHQRMMTSASARAGSRAGSAAAEEVVIGRTTTPANRVTGTAGAIGG